MSLGRTIAIAFTPDELMTIAYNMLGSDTLKNAGLTPQQINAMITTDAMARVRTKLSAQLPACRGAAPGTKIDKDRLMESIRQASR